MDQSSSERDETLVPRLGAVRVVVDATPEARIVIDEAEQIRWVNPAACDLLGYAATDLVGQAFDILVPAGREGQVDDLRNAWLAAPVLGPLGSDMDLRVRCADGTELPIEVQVTPVTTDEGLMVIVALRDVTSAQHDTRLFRALLEAAPDAVVIVDEGGTIRMVNEAAEKCFGYLREEMQGRSMELLVPDRFAQHHRHLRKGMFAAPHSRPMNGAGTLSAKRKDGSEFPVEISLAPVITEEGPLIIADVRDVTERLAAVDAVRVAEERQRVLAETDRAKDQFLATVSHELRTPLASIIGFAELIMDLEGLPPQLDHFMNILMRNARREARLVEDLLTVVHINEQGLAVHAAPVDLRTVVTEAVESAQPKATENAINLELRQPADPLLVTCDGERIGQVLDSLLSNALKFTPSGGRVHVHLEKTAQGARIEVADSGIGIGDPEPHRVFERLYRSPTAIEREIPGAGLGLSIAAAIIAAHQGSIRVLNTDHTGSTFEVLLPLHGHPNATTPA